MHQIANHCTPLTFNSGNYQGGLEKYEPHIVFFLFVESRQLTEVVGTF